MAGEKGDGAPWDDFRLWGYKGGAEIGEEIRSESEGRRLLKRTQRVRGKRGVGPCSK